MTIPLSKTITQIPTNTCSTVHIRALLTTKVFLRRGETRRITIPLNEESFRFYDCILHDFKVESGKFDIFVGASSHDIRLTTNLTIE